MSSRNLILALWFALVFAILTETSCGVIEPKLPDEPVATGVLAVVCGVVGTYLLAHLMVWVATHEDDANRG